MKEKKYCEYCGNKLHECECMNKTDFIEEYGLDTQYGWYQQDLIDMRKREQ